MSDELGLFNDRHTDHRDPRSPRARRRRRQRSGRKFTLWVSVLIVLVLIGGGVWFGLTQILDIGSYEDYSGPGDSDVLVEVSDGDSTGDIAQHLQEQGVVGSTKAFVKAAEGEPRVRNIQPGYYVLKTKVSGKDAVTKMLDPASRKGNLQIKAGSQLADLKTDGGVEPGIVTRLHNASCADLNGKSTCVPVEELFAVAEKADLAALGVPDWAVPDASKLEPRRRLEGLVMPDVYDVRPGSTAEQLWHKVITDSSARMQAIGMPRVAADTGFTPFQVLTMASLIQAEAIEKDFAKVSRVTYNRLADQKKLEYDSTVNYVLERPAIRTKLEDRAKEGAYNTYANTGLTPGPISSPSKAAIDAAVKPEDGPWLFFVRCEKDGTSCFAETREEHDKNSRDAQARGAW